MLMALKNPLQHLIKTKNSMVVQERIITAALTVVLWNFLWL